MIEAFWFRFETMAYHISGKRWSTSYDEQITKQHTLCINLVSLMLWGNHALTWTKETSKTGNTMEESMLEEKWFFVLHEALICKHLNASGLIQVWISLKYVGRVGSSTKNITKDCKFSSKTFRIKSNSKRTQTREPVAYHRLNGKQWARWQFQVTRPENVGIVLKVKEMHSNLCFIFQA